MTGKRAITVLRVICLVVMLLGVGGVIDGIMHSKSVPLFAFDVPTWIIALSVFYMGLRYWRRIPELEKKVQYSKGFSWEHFPVVGSRSR
jgi:hypothetical protein